jgi:hypothetical protein
MFSNNKKQNSKSKGSKSSEATGKNCAPKAKAMSPIARLMATFYGVDNK